MRGGQIQLERAGALITHKSGANNQAKNARGVGRLPKNLKKESEEPDCRGKFS